MVQGRRTEEKHGIIANHLFMVIVSQTTSRTGGPFISSTGSGHDGGTEGFGVVRRGLKRLHHRWSLHIAA